MTPTSSGRWSNLSQRVGMGLLLAAVSMVMIWWGRAPFMLEVGWLALVGSGELFDLLERKRLRPMRRSGTLGVLLMLGCTWWSGPAGLLEATLISVVGILFLSVVRSGVRQSLVLDVAGTFLTLFYVGFLFSFLVLLRALPGGAGWLTLLIAMIASCDTAAYFVGRSLGRHKLCPQLSPKKTVEGSLAGALVPALLGYHLGPLFGLSPWHAAGLGLGVSCIGQVGDLWESALKREVGVKDAGEFLGAHGGVLDRFDSLALAAPFFYWAVTHLN